MKEIGDNMEYLDIYDENKKYLGKYSREYVHQNALWHNTVHCWLYDTYGNVYFQIRKEEEKLYTTASGHVLSGETIKEAFGREVKEEIGINIPYEDAIFIDTHEYKADKIKKDGTIFKDRAFVNVYGYLYSNQDTDFKFDLSEVNGLVKRLRVRQVLEISSEYERKYYESYIGNVLEGLVEVHKDGKVIVLTSNYISVIVDDIIDSNMVVKVRIDRVDDYNNVYGSLV